MDLQQHILKKDPCFSLWTSEKHWQILLFIKVGLAQGILVGRMFQMFLIKSEFESFFAYLWEK